MYSVDPLSCVGNEGFAFAGICHGVDESVDEVEVEDCVVPAEGECFVVWDC